MPPRCLLIAVDSVGIDPRGHQHPESIYRESEFLFPQNASGDLLPLLESSEGDFSSVVGDDLNDRKAVGLVSRRFIRVQSVSHLWLKTLLA